MNEGSKHSKSLICSDFSKNDDVEERNKTPVKCDDCESSIEEDNDDESALSKSLTTLNRKTSVFSQSMIDWATNQNPSDSLPSDKWRTPKKIMTSTPKQRPETSTEKSNDDNHDDKLTTASNSDNSPSCIGTKFTMIQILIILK